MTYFQLLKKATNILAKHIKDAQKTAEQLLCYTFQISKVELLANLNQKISSQTQIKIFTKYIQKRISHIPLEYLIGSCQFHGSTYIVNKRVLIPRPETELIIDLALQRIKKENFSSIIEIGFGTGIISIEIAKYFPQIPIYAWDISALAYKNAQKNLQLHKIKSITLYKNNFFKDKTTWISLFKDTLSTNSQNHHRPLIISNPPYVSKKEYSNLQQEIKNHEPKTALIAGKNGLSFYKKLFKILPPHKNNYLLEIGYNQKSFLKKLIGKNTNYTFYLDYNHIPRVLSTKTSS